MAAQLSFTLKDRYTMKIWNPVLLGETEIKSLTGEFFFSVLFSVYRERQASNSQISEHAKKILAKFVLDMSAFEKEVIGLINVTEMKKSESVFTVSFVDAEPKAVKFSPGETSGICPENAAFLRSFVKFDEYIALLNEIQAMAIITEKEYFIQRKTAQSKIRGIMEGYNNLIKRFHTERKKVKTKLESVA